MRDLSLQGIFLLCALSSLVLTSGCARQPKAVSFVPVAEQNLVEVDTEGKLENLPLETLIYKGRIYLQQENLSLAHLHLSKALTKTSDNVEVYQLLGELFMKQKQLGKAKTTFSKVHELNPENQTALLGLGKIYRLEGDCAKAESYLQQARKLAPNNPDVLTEMAICYDSLEQSAQAEKLYLRVVELQPANSSSFNNLGFHYMIHGAYPQAIDAFLAGSKLKREDRRIKNNLAAAYILNGDEVQGLSLFANSIGQAGAYNNAGYIYMVQNRWQKAEAAFVKALELNPSYYVKAARNLDYLKSLAAYKRTQP
ncbi:MAG: tetratricopeptide repeat protein [Desulfuromonadales bacterium]